MKTGACAHIDAVDTVKPAKAYECEAVSYTHLTLPTILRV